MKKNITFSDCKSYEDIEAKILAALEYDELVDDEAAARQWFKYAGIEGDVIIGDPAAGSSRCLLAAHALFMGGHHRKPYLVAEDSDEMCCKMSAVNLMAHGCFGEVICHDTLADPRGVKVGYVINEGLYPLPGVPTIRVHREPEWFVSLR